MCNHRSIKKFRILKNHWFQCTYIFYRITSRPVVSNLLTLIVPANIKVDLTDFDIKLWKTSYELYWKEISFAVIRSWEFFLTSYRISEEMFWVYVKIQPMPHSVLPFPRLAECGVRRILSWPHSLALSKWTNSVSFRAQKSQIRTVLLHTSNVKTSIFSKQFVSLFCIR